RGLAVPVLDDERLARVPLRVDRARCAGAVGGALGAGGGGPHFGADSAVLGDLRVAIQVLDVRLASVRLAVGGAVGVRAAACVLDGLAAVVLVALLPLEVAAEVHAAMRPARVDRFSVVEIDALLAEV